VKVAVTGASGYIGRWLMPELLRRGHEVHAQDIVRANGPATWDSFSTFDLRSPARAEWLVGVRPDVIIHLAAIYGRVWGEADLGLTALVNAGLTAEVARGAASVGARVLYVSSSEVYGISADHGTVTPRSSLFPRNMYGLTKKWGEEACEVYAPDGLQVARLNMPYGPAYEPPQPGEIPHASGRPGIIGYNVVHSMLWLASHNMDITVHTGTTRCLTWVGDTVRGIVMVMESGREGTWNVNRNDDHRDVADLAKTAVALTGSSSAILEEDPPERVTMHKWLDNAELLALGWSPTVDLETGMTHCKHYFQRFDENGRWQG
jgi:nucleoside-diphosphate-sugar epimerase